MSTYRRIKQQPQQTNRLEVIGNLYKYHIFSNTLGFLSEVGTCMAWLLFLQYVYYCFIRFSYNECLGFINYFYGGQAKTHAAYSISSGYRNSIGCVRRTNGTRIKFPETNKNIPTPVAAKSLLPDWKWLKWIYLKINFGFIDAVGGAAFPVQYIHSFVINIIQ